MTELPATSLTSMQQRVAREIVAITRKENLATGDRLVESALATQIGTSRSPVNAALRHLQERGIVRYDANRGYSMARPAHEIEDVAPELFVATSDTLYLQIARDRLAHLLPEIVTEAELIRRYDAPRTAILRVFSTMQEEGWIERTVGRAWQFLPMIDSLQAYEESYVFREAVEPTGLLAPQFKFDAAELARLRKHQQRIVDGGYLSMSPIELFDANSDFHETVAKWSANRFVAQAVRRIHRMRRLVDYRQERAREPRRQDAVEHLAILDAIDAGNLIAAAMLMRDHIESGRRTTGQARDAFGETGPAAETAEAAKAPVDSSDS
ncbi:GntR family transcriptional regulator [Paraburkholderia xenovorans]|uniref:GntR family transcriptional regulator n=1 Tax=Paraburkholderia xenovorans TaxID=36873 RepID=UPI0038BD0AC2